MPVKTKNKFVWVLTGNDPGTLGGPMGTEHIGPIIITRVFDTASKAKAFAQRYVDRNGVKHTGNGTKDTLVWDKASGVFESADALWVLFDLERKVVK